MRTAFPLQGSTASRAGYATSRLSLRVVDLATVNPCGQQPFVTSVSKRHLLKPGDDQTTGQVLAARCPPHRPHCAEARTRASLARQRQAVENTRTPPAAPGPARCLCGTTGLTCTHLLQRATSTKFKDMIESSRQESALGSCVFGDVLQWHSGWRAEGAVPLRPRSTARSECAGGRVVSGGRAPSRTDRRGCRPGEAVPSQGGPTSYSLRVPFQVQPWLGQTAGRLSTSLRAALSGKAWGESARG